MGIDAERQERAKEYARIRHRLFALDLILSAVALLVVLFSGLSVWLRGIVLSISTNAWIATALYSIVGFSAYGLLYLPLTCYSGFVLPHRYGLSTQTLRAWLVDVAKGGALGIVLGGLVIEVIYALLRAAPEGWWLWASAFMILFSVVLANLNQSDQDKPGFAVLPKLSVNQWPAFPCGGYFPPRVFINAVKPYDSKAQNLAPHSDEQNNHHRPHRSQLKRYVWRKRSRTPRSGQENAINFVP